MNFLVGTVIPAEQPALMMILAVSDTPTSILNQAQLHHNRRKLPIVHMALLTNSLLPSHIKHSVMEHKHSLR